MAEWLKEFFIGFAWWEITFIVFCFIVLILALIMISNQIIKQIRGG